MKTTELKMGAWEDIQCNFPDELWKRLKPATPKRPIPTKVTARLRLNLATAKGPEGIFPIESARSMTVMVAV